MSREIALTETEIENFAAVVRFIVKNDLWDEAKTALDAAGVTTILVSTEPILVIKQMIAGLLPGDRLDQAGREHGLVIAECGCGVSTPGPPGHGPEFPHGGGDAGPDAGVPVTHPADGGT